MSREQHYVLTASVRSQIVERLSERDLDLTSRITKITDAFAGRDDQLLGILLLAKNKRELSQAVDYFSSRIKGHSAEHGKDYKQSLPYLERVIATYIESHSSAGPGKFRSGA